MQTYDPLNWRRSGGQFDRMVRRLQHFTIVLNPINGRYLVKDDRNGETIGAGYKTPEEAVKAYETYDYRRIWGHRA